jgi:hypothetical protein
LQPEEFTGYRRKSEDAENVRLPKWQVLSGDIIEMENSSSLYPKGQIIKYTSYVKTEGREEQNE